MDDYPLKMLIFNRARLIKNSKNRIPYGVDLIQKYKRDSWIVFTENKKQAKEFNTIINKKGFKSGIYNTDLKDDERQENLEDFKKGKLKNSKHFVSRFFILLLNSAKLLFLLKKINIR